VAWWVNITREVVEGLQSFGFQNPSPEQILQSVEHYLRTQGETWFEDRWNKCPEQFFVFTHILAEGGRLHTLEFVVEDTSKTVGVLNVVWVEHYPGNPL